MSIAASTAWKLQQRRRDQERILHGTQSFLSQHQNTEIRHDWEARTQKRIEQREVDAITEKLLRQDDEDLGKRKEELSALLDDEMSHWKRTLQSSSEVTQEERMERIRKRAYELKAKREAEREAFVEECYERQWRDACDDLRAFDSKATLDRIVKDRECMIRRRDTEARNRVKQDESEAMSLIHKDESDDQSRRRRANLEFKMALDHQLEWKRSRAESISRQTQLEEREELRELAALEREAKEYAKESIEKARRDGEDLLRETRARAEVSESRQDMERKQNLILLQHALDNEQGQIQAEQAKKEVGKDLASEYIQCLRQQMKLEENESEHLNSIRKGELERLARVNDDKIATESDTRRRWMEDVDTSRQAQIQRKRIKEKALREEMDRDDAELKASLLQAEEADARDAEKAQALRMENMLYNRGTMDERAKKRERELKEKDLLQRQIQDDQREYRKRLEDQRKKCGVGDLI